MDTGIIIAIISGVVSIATTIITVTHSQRCTARNSKMLNAKTRILLQILDDRFTMSTGKSPKNYQSIMTDYDEYVENGGNSYVKQKIDDYKLEVNEYDLKA